MSRTKFDFPSIKQNKYNQTYDQLKEVFVNKTFNTHQVGDIAKILFYFNNVPENLTNENLILLLSSRIDLMEFLKNAPNNIDNLIKGYIDEEESITKCKIDLDTKFNLVIQRNNNVPLNPTFNPTKNIEETSLSGEEWEE